MWTCTHIHTFGWNLWCALYLTLYILVINNKYHTHTYTHVHISTHTRTRTHTKTHTHSHTHTPSQRAAPTAPQPSGRPHNCCLRQPPYQTHTHTHKHTHRHYHQSQGFPAAQALQKLHAGFRKEGNTIILVLLTPPSGKTMNTSCEALFYCFTAKERKNNTLSGRKKQKRHGSCSEEGTLDIEQH